MAVEDRMKINSTFFPISAFFICALCVSCGAKLPVSAKAMPRPETKHITESSFSYNTDISSNLERIAEIERTGVYYPGLALAESGLRERAGDFSGAAIAAYKELSWAYGCSAAGREQVEEGLNNALKFFRASPDIINSHANISGGDSPGGNANLYSAAASALIGCIAFAREDWVQAEEFLMGLLSDDEEPDSFLRWMLMVCALESKKRDAGEIQAIRSAYGAIRARYAVFPEYWYRGARAYGNTGSTAFEKNIVSSYAEHCINTSPDGPFSESCRTIISHNLGLSSGTIQKDILTKAEIENIIRASVSASNPVLLEDLFPLIALPDNPYTLYALGALKALSSVPEYLTFFTGKALSTSGRLAERLNYISRG